MRRSVRRCTGLRSSSNWLSCGRTRDLGRTPGQGGHLDRGIDPGAGGGRALPAGEAEGAEIARLNGAYTRRFGFPFVICARLNAKDAILAAMRARLSNTPDEELSTALAEIAKIARLRLNDALAKPS